MERAGSNPADRPRMVPVMDGASSILAPAALYPQPHPEQPPRMFDPPKTREDAVKRRYRQWAGSPKGTPYVPSRCAYEVPDSGRSPLSSQCSRNKGYGPNCLYCKQHGKRFAASVS